MTLNQVAMWQHVSKTKSNYDNLANRDGKDQLVLVISCRYVYNIYLIL